MKSRDKANALIAVLVILGLFLIWGPQPDSVSNASRSPSARRRSISDIDRKIEEQMKKGRFSEELLRERMALENTEQAPRPNGQIDPSAYSSEKEPVPIVFKGDNPGERMLKEQAEPDLQQRYNSLTPDQRITKKINRDEYAREYEKLQEEAFVQQYIQNARKQGYDIKLNSKGEIVSSEYIGVVEPQGFPSETSRTPQSENALKSEGNAAQ